MRAVKRTPEGIECVEVPDASGDGVPVRVVAAGICGTDVTMASMGPLPVVLGHEVAGVLADGTQVAIEPVVPCGACDTCTRGDYQLCRRLQIVGITRDGGMAERVVVPSRCLVPLPGNLDVRDACLVEPLAVAVHGLRVAGLTAGMRVGVVGAGTIGLCALAAARALGCEAGVVARHPHQIAAAEELGGREPTGEHDVVVEAAGTPAALARAVELCRPAGTVVVLSSWWGEMPLDAGTAMLKELRLSFALMYNRQAVAREIDAAAALLASAPAIARTLITHRFPIEEAASAFRTAADRRTGAIKVVVEPA